MSSTMIWIVVQATLGAVPDVKQAVVLPEGEDLHEWLAVNSTSTPRGRDRDRIPNTHLPTSHPSLCVFLEWPCAPFD